MDASALASTLDNLENSWSSLDWWLNFWTILVVVGVAVELLVLSAEYMHDWRDFRRSTIHSPNRPSLIVFGLGFLGAGLVAIGVAGEFRVHIKAGKIETDIRDATRQLVAIAENETGKANERAGKADERSKQLEQGNLTLQEELLKLRLKMADRHVTSGGQSRIAGALCRFAGRNVQINLYDSDGEIQALAKDIEGALPEKCGANIGFVVSTGMLKAAIGFSGIRVILKADSPQSDKDFANLVVSAFQAERLKTDGPMPPQPFGTLSGGGGAVRRVIGINGDPITIEIGKKP